MAVVDQGGGGGRAGVEISDVFALDKPYDLSGEPSIEKMQQIDEMFHQLFQWLVRNKDRVTDIETSVAGLSGITSVLSATVSITEGEYRALNTVPKTLIEPVTGKLIIPLVVAKRVTVSSAFSASSNGTVRYIGSGTSVVTIGLAANGTARYDSLRYVSAGYDNTATDHRGEGVEVVGSAALTGGTFSAGMTFTVFYVLVDWAA